MKVAIHQPNFFPWLGFFDKINNADVFVVLNHVINRPNDGSWLKRVKILINKEPTWITIPVINPKGVEFQQINEFEIDTSNKLLSKVNKSIELNYKRAPFFTDVFPVVQEYFDSEENLLQNRNMNFIQKVLDNLNIKTKIIFSDQLNCEFNSTELLIEIVKEIGGKTYLSGDGSGGYQENQLFEQNNITLAYNNFDHPVYKQYNISEFIPGLSIVDALMNLGFEQTKNLFSR